MAAGKSQYRGLKGQNRLRKILGRMPETASAEVKTLVAEMAQEVLNDARLYAGRGSMASKRYAAALGRRRSRSGFTADVGLLTKTAKKKAWFAHFIEFGTRAGVRVWRGKRKGSMKHPGTPRRPVLKPAFEIERVRYLPRFSAAIDDALRRTAAGADDS